MQTPISPEKVIIERNGQTATGITLHQLNLDVFNEKREIIPGKIGEFLGIAVMLDVRQQVVYAQPSQLTPY